MTDRTNAPYDPAAAETSHEWATRVGQEHDTWHRLEQDGSQLEDLTLQSVVPDTMNATVATEIHFHGTGFTARSKVRLQGSDYATSHGVVFISEGELSMILPSVMTLLPGDSPVQIKEGFDVSNQNVILHILP